MKEYLTDCWYYYFVGGWDMFKCYTHMYMDIVQKFMADNALTIIVAVVVYVWLFDKVIPRYAKDIKAIKDCIIK